MSRPPCASAPSSPSGGKVKPRALARGFSVSRAMRRQRSEIAAFVVAPQVEAHVRIGVGAKILVVVVDRVAVGRARLLGAADGLIVLRRIHLLRRRAGLGAARAPARTHPAWA